ncbi:methyltransf_25 domain-containing protein [Caerostris extrusa]|uniref:Methyltransf_25 domain-containing protein n=1 Tax=Caerostris extrusa TaxID=172846 RepID=A0AAV4SSB0_CAEEX|nr:methyltransf_25 domain-containing protein [Caerostris extrusa]
MHVELYEKTEPLGSVIHFLTVILESLGWNEEGDTLAMDVGCGAGNVTTKWILPVFPNIKKMIALDHLPGMIQQARANHSHPKVEFHVANFEDSSSVEQWKGQISKLVSIHVFNWFKDQKKCFQTVYDLLQPGGEAALYFVLHSDFYAGVVDVTKDPKWSPYFKGVDSWVPESHFKRYDSSHYKKIAKDIGFSIVFCENEMKVNKLPSEKYAKDLYYSISALAPYVPTNLKEEYKEDLYQHVLRNGGINADGTQVHRASTLEIVLRKE